MVAELVSEGGPLSGIVHAAGVQQAKPLRVVGSVDFESIFRINVVAAAMLIKGVSRRKMARERGCSCVLIGSAMGAVWAPGLTAYCASKAALAGLVRASALELAPRNIRVNQIDAAAIVGDDEPPSGLGAHIGPTRAKSRDLKLEDLPEYYRQRNLLHARVRGHHVGRAVVFFAGNATPTTGATLPVDGGVVEAFPR